MTERTKKLLDKYPITEEEKEKFANKVIDGKEIADTRNKLMKAYCEKLKEDYELTPTLAIVHVVGDYGSAKYVTNKKKTGDEIGIHTEIYEYDPDVTTSMLLQVIEDLNKDDSVHGILVQMPLPEHIDTKAIIRAIRPIKDVDGFHPYNVGELHSGNVPIGRVPCTAYGIIQLIKSTGEEIAGTKAVVLGRSNIVGRPVAALLEQENSTVTVCHSKTPSAEMALAIRSADIIVSAIGKPNYINRAVIGLNKTIIDVGINQDEDGKLCGDVAFLDALVMAKYITPVPGGVGPMTISCLMENTLRCLINQNNIDQNELIL